MYQEINLCPNLSVAENIYIGREPRRAGRIDWKTINRKAAELLGRFNMNIDVTQNLDAYSVAVQQMVAIARAVDISARVLILDEPRAGLDPGGCEGRLRNITDYRRETGSTVLFVTHSMDDAARIADRLIVFHDGGIAMDGTPEEVFSHAQELTEMGLDVPQPAAIAAELRRRGAALPESIYTSEQLHAAVLAWLRKGGSAGC